MNKPLNDQLSINGPCGVLEAQLAEAPGTTPQRALAILCHPHPQYGGSMHDGVLDSAARVLHDHGVDALRFNFRGVGQSAGTYGDGIGEVDDLLAVRDWAQATYPDAQIWLVGYSFGAHIAHQAAAAVNPATIMLIAPASRMMRFEPSPLDAVTHAVAGDRDDFADAAQLTTWLGARVQIIPGADHFFSADRAALETALTSWVTQTMTAPVSHS